MGSRPHDTVFPADYPAGFPPDRFWFVGVHTNGSAAFAAFPGWMEALGHTGALIGVDLPINAPDEAYRHLVERLRADPAVI